uniref:Uncharacterized protein n=1 Tax=Glossina brevipalpis TaxID=37001 RepID=A0A1A9X2R6_9MUSC
MEIKNCSLTVFGWYTMSTVLNTVPGNHFVVAGITTQWESNFDNMVAGLKVYILIVIVTSGFNGFGQFRGEWKLQKFEGNCLLRIVMTRKFLRSYILKELKFTLDNQIAPQKPSIFGECLSKSSSSLEIAFASCGNFKQLGSAKSIDACESTVLQIKAISLPCSEEYWNIFITHCTSTVEMWLKISRFTPQTTEDFWCARLNMKSFMQRLPIFVSIDNDFYNVDGLLKLCDVLTENPS